MKERAAAYSGSLSWVGPVLVGRSGIWGPIGLPWVGPVFRRSDGIRGGRHGLPSPSGVRGQELAVIVMLLR